MPVRWQMSAKAGHTSGQQDLPSFSPHSHSGHGHSTPIVAQLIFWSQASVANVRRAILNTKEILKADKVQN